MTTKYCPQCQQAYQEPQRFCPTDGELLSLRDPYNLVGRTIVEKYHVKALIGIGGMGVVYNAQHLSLDRRVAIKILQPNIAIKNLHTLDLFQKEAKLAARLFHENIVSILDAGRTVDDIAYMVMEWLDGRTLEEELGASGPLSIERAGKILRQIVAALKEAHAQHIIHRDLKPANIMLIRRSAEQDVVKVLDFGIAKLVNDTMGAAVSQIMGTPHYASPEQLQIGVQIDGRSDVYSLGIMLYEMLTGKLPFNASSFQGLVRLHLTAPPPSIRHFRPELPVAIEQLINQLMAKAPEQRPQIAVVPSLFEQAFENIYEPQRKGRESFLTADDERVRGQIEEAHKRQDVSRANVEAETEKIYRLERERAPNDRMRSSLNQPAEAASGINSTPHAQDQSNPAPPSPQPRVESIAAPRIANTRIKWAVGACIVALSGVILAYWFLYLNSQATHPIGITGPTPTNNPPPRSEQARNIDDLAVVTLEAPPFRAGAATPVQGETQEFELNLLSAQPNSITDEDNWFESNQLPRLPEVLLPTQSANMSYQNLHEAIPRSWQGKKLITAIIQQDRALLIYGEFYYNALLLASLNLSTKVFEYGLDFKNYGYSPENIPEERQFTHQYIHWATQVEDILYVSHGHNTYARSSKGRTGYVTAINIKDNRALWSSPALISNSRNFEIIDDYLITGYGFTEEPDFLYVLRRKTGDVTQKITLKSGPDYIIRKNDNIFVRTYDTDYIFRIKRKI
jgi:serine/threonine protein kinase